MSQHQCWSSHFHIARLENMSLANVDAGWFVRFCIVVLNTGSRTSCRREMSCILLTIKSQDLKPVNAVFSWWKLFCVERWLWMKIADLLQWNPGVNRIQSLWNRNTRKQPWKQPGAPGHDQLFDSIWPKHTCIRPQLVRRSPTASSSLILQVLKTWKTIHGHHMSNVLINQHWFMNLSRRWHLEYPVRPCAENEIETSLAEHG